MNAKQEIIPASGQVPAATTVQSESSALILMIERVAMNPEADMDKLERLLLMKERMFEQRAEQEFNAAMSEAQAEMGLISVDAKNPQTKSKYATYGKIDQAIRPIYTKHGFAVSFDTGSDAPAEYVRVMARVSHRSGFARTYHADMPADGKGAKGGDVMTKTHAAGAAMSYGMRYLLKMIFNVAIGEDDKDGNELQSDAKPITEDQVMQLRDLLEAHGRDEKRFLAHIKLESLSDIYVDKFAAAVAIIKGPAK
jgi:hypothetical protein